MPSVVEGDAGLLTRPPQQVFYTQHPCNESKIPQVETVASHLEHSHRMRPLTLRHLIAEAEPIQLLCDDTLWAGDGEFTRLGVTGQEALAPLHLPARNLVILRHEDVHLEQRTKMDEVERSMLLDRIANRGLVEIERPALRIDQSENVLRLNARHEIDVLRGARDAVQRARQ